MASVSKGYIFFSIFSYAIQCWYFVLFSGTKPENLILKNKTNTLLLYYLFSLAFYFWKTIKWEMCYMALGFSLTGVTKWSTCFQSAMIYFVKNLQTCKTPIFVLIKLYSLTWLRYEVGQRHLEPNFELQMLRWSYFLIILKPNYSKKQCSSSLFLLTYLKAITQVAIGYFDVLNA